MRKLVLEWRKNGDSIALVPTMGALHAGHLSLIEHAKKVVASAASGGNESYRIIQGVTRKCSDGQKFNLRIVVSNFVNPLQFAPNEDYANYPRTLDADMALCEKAGVDAMFAPSTEEMYPNETEDLAARRQTCYVTENNLSQSMEGVTRPIHFRGVMTVVTKLFHIVGPDIAIFGEKDFQQAAIIRRMVRDLDFPVKIETAPIIREKDGLAMSSRNRYLNADERRQALCLSQAIKTARQRFAEGITVADKLRAELTVQIEQNPSAKVDYIKFVDSETLTEVNQLDSKTRITMAVYVGKTRLIDNAGIVTPTL